MHPEDGVVPVRAHIEAGGHDRPVVDGPTVDVLDPLDALDDLFQRLGDELDRVLRPQPVRLDPHVDHGNPDLGLLLPGQHGQGEAPEGEGAQEEQGGQGRVDEDPGDVPGESELHRPCRSGRVPAGGRRRSPARSPLRISTRGGASGDSGVGRTRPSCTTTPCAPPGVSTRA